MKNRHIQLTLALIALIVGGALEEMLPKALGVGFPILLSLVQLTAARRTTLAMLLFALAAGAVEDAISSLPSFTSVSYFLAVAILARWANVPRVAMVFTYPVYQLWLTVWAADLQGGVFGRMLIAVPFGAITAYATVMVILFTEAKVAIDEQG